MSCYTECQQRHDVESYSPSQTSGALWMKLNEWMWETRCHIWRSCCLTSKELTMFHCWSVLSYWWEKKKKTWKLNTESQHSWLQKCSDWGHTASHIKLKVSGFFSLFLPSTRMQLQPSPSKKSVEVASSLLLAVYVTRGSGKHRRDAALLHAKVQNSPAPETCRCISHRLF